MKKHLSVIVLASLVAILVSACAPQVAPSSATAPPAQAPVASAPASKAATKAPANEAWQEKWNAMVEGAKKEGKVVIYTTSAAQTRAAWQKAFKERFGVNAEFMAGQSAQFAPKIMAEHRAGLRLADVLTASSSIVLSALKPAGLVAPIDFGDVLVLPELSDPKLWLGGTLVWQDAERMCLMFSRFESDVVARNTELVKEGEVQSYNDLMNPKWKGKIMVMDPATMALNLKAVAMVGRHTMGWDWVRALAKQEPVITSDWRLQLEWLAHGKYPLAYSIKKDMFFEFKQAGSPVELVKMSEGAAFLSSGAGQVSLLKYAGQPNAARLFINWLLTKEGQEIFSRTGGFPSVRLDVSDEGLLNRRASPDTKAPDADSEQSYLQQVEDLKLIKEIFQTLLKK